MRDCSVPDSLELTSDLFFGKGAGVAVNSNGRIFFLAWQNYRALLRGRIVSANSDTIVMVRIQDPGAAAHTRFVWRSYLIFLTTRSAAFHIPASFVV